MRRHTATLILTSLLALGCGGSPAPAPSAPTSPPAPTEAAPAESTLGQPMSIHGMTMYNFPPLTIGAYEVQPMFEDDITDGHYNIRVRNGEVKAVRIWVGNENADGVVVAKTELENDYHHGHVELPDPIPADAQLWIEIEAPDGTLHKGATPLEVAS